MAASAVWGTPWGGTGGSRDWEFIMPDGASLTKIEVKCGDALDSIRFTYKDRSGSTHTSDKFGGTGGAPRQIIFADDEYLIRISGRVGSYGGNLLITSVTFHTNINTYGEYGTNPGTDFSFGVVKGKFSGFYGKYGSNIDSLGVIVQP